MFSDRRERIVNQYTIIDIVRQVGTMSFMRFSYSLFDMMAQFEIFPFRYLGDSLFFERGVCVLSVACVVIGKGLGGVSAVPVTSAFVVAAPLGRRSAGPGRFGGAGSARWVICCEHRRVR